MSRTPRTILGVSALYHDAAACVLRDGEIVAAAQEERFTRKKGDARIPAHALTWALAEAGVGRGELDLVVYMDKPITKFNRLLSTYAATAPRGLRSYLAALPTWLREKAWPGHAIESLLARGGHGRPRDFQFVEHHHAHAASAFYASPFPEAATLTVDGVGEWTTSAIGVGEGERFRMLYEQRFPHSLGMLYSAFTYYTGFKVNSGEYKLMGLAPYGEPTYVERIHELITLREDGSFRLDLRFFDFLAGFTMTSPRFHTHFGGPPRRPDEPITQRHMDIARSIQAVTEDIMLRMARFARAVTGKRHLCLAGGVALNCVANGKIARAGLFDDLFIQPAAGDAGGALGAALYAWHHIHGQPRGADGVHDRQHGSLLGPRFDQATIQAWLDGRGYPYVALEPEARDQRVAEHLAAGKVVGLFQGRMEFGPRALCNRSILGDARSPRMQSHLNLATKFRESFRPFAPVCLQRAAHRYFEAIHHSPYMLLVDQVRPERLNPAATRGSAEDLYAWVNTPRSDVPAITHVDGSARIQTIDPERNPRMHRILERFEALTGEAILINTSFNVRSEPIVCTPEDAYVCFMRSGIDTLVLEDLILYKADQPPWQEDGDWRDHFEVD